MFKSEGKHYGEKIVHAQINASTAHVYVRVTIQLHLSASLTSHRYVSPGLDPSLPWTLFEGYHKSACSGPGDVWTPLKDDLADSSSSQ